MDDSRTRQTLDALADLFLTEPETQTPPAQDTAADDQAPENGTDLRQSEPNPMRLPPKTPVAAVLNGGDTCETVEETPPLTLRMPRPDSDRRVQSRRAGPGEAETLHLEAVVLGNLPVLGRPWLTQYAHRLSQTRGPVIVLHVDAEQIEAELISTTDARCASLATAGDDEVSQAGGETLAALLQTLTNSKVDAARTCLVHMQPPDPPQDRGSAQDWATPIRRWTLLCGADEAAIVAAYQLVKKLLEADPDHADRHVGLVVMGSDEDASIAVAARLNETVGRFLATPVELLYSQKQMVPVRQRPIGRFANSQAQWLELISFLNRASPAGVLQAVAAERHASDPLIAGRVAAVNPLVDSDGFATLPDAAEHRAVQANRAASSGGPENSPARVADDEVPTDLPLVPLTLAPEAPAPETLAPEIPAPESAVPESLEHEYPEREHLDPVQLEPESTPDLLRLLGTTLTGAVALEARCPAQPSTQLVLDQSGRLHLLRRQVDSRNEDLRTALIDLMEARAWVRQHLSLLRLTMRQCRFDMRVKPVMHLFTSESKLAATLVGRVGRYVRLHVLQRVRVGERCSWVSTDLN